MGGECVVAVAAAEARDVKANAEAEPNAEHHLPPSLKAPVLEYEKVELGSGVSEEVVWRQRLEKVDAPSLEILEWMK